MRTVLGLLLITLVAGCSTPPPPPAVIERANGDATVSASRTQGLVVDAYAYWAALEGQRWHQAWRYHTLEYRSATGFDQWLSTVRQQSYSDRRPTEVVWSKRAHRAQGPELYAAMRWVNTQGRAGRLIWRQEASGAFLIENADPL